MGPGESDRLAALRKARWWLCQASQYERQWEHLVHADLDNGPVDDAQLEALQLTEAPAEVVDDETFYGEKQPQLRRGRRRAAPQAPGASGSGQPSQDREVAEPPRKRARVTPAPCNPCARQVQACMVLACT